MGHAALRAPVTAVVAAALAVGTTLVFSPLLEPLRHPVVLVVVAAVAGGLGLLAGILGSYDLTTPSGWALLVLDHTWALVSTLVGAVLGNLVYPFFGTPSSRLSAGQDWVSYAPRGTSGFGVDVLQTIGTVNLGGPGAHERVHLLQARTLGPLFLPIVVVSYIATFLIQLLFTVTVGLVLRLTRVRDTAWFRAPASSAVPGFWGWIYAATPMELWAYATEP